MSLKLLSEEKFIKLIFLTQDQNNYYSIAYKKSVIFSKLEDIFFEKYPEYINGGNFLISNENKINRNKTLEYNNNLSGLFFSFLDGKKFKI